MDWLDLLQWPAMAITIAATYLVGSSGAGRREVGFWLFLLSNGLWVAWGLQAAAWALVILQGFLAVMNVRGAKKNDEIEEGEESGGGGGGEPKDEPRSPE